MRTIITIQEEGFVPYVVTIKDSQDEEYPIEGHLSRQGRAGEGAEFKDAQEAATWVAKWIEDYLGYVKLEDTK